MESPNFPPPASRGRAPLDLTDPKPLAATAAFWRSAAQFSAIGIFIIMIGAALDLARVVLLPVTCAIVIGAMFGPLIRLAVAYRIPSWLGATAVVVAFLLLLQAATLLVSAPIIAVVSNASDFGDALKAKLQALEEWAYAFRSMSSIFSAGVKIDLPAVIQPVLGFLTPAVGELVVFFATLFAFLLGQDALRKTLIFVFAQQDDRLRILRILNDIERNLTRYFGTVSVINLGLGVVTAAGAWLLGFKNPALLGALAFLCNYIPYIGPALVVLILFAVGLITFPSLAQASLPPVLYIGLATVEGHFITPNIVGKRLTLNPLVVILSLAFWTWLWGPVGTFLSMPLLIVGLVTFSHIFTMEEGELPD